MTVELEKRGPVAIMTFNRPEKLNAMSYDMRRQMEKCVADVRDDTAIRALVITGAGDAFCAGGDISSFGGSALFMRDRLKQQHRTTLSLFYLEKPVIVAVNGPAVGVGFNIALLGDIILASETAKFSQIYAKVGIVPDGGGLWLLARMVGMQRAKELVLLAETISATAARDLGIVRAVYGKEALMAEAMALAERLADGPTRAFGLDKALLHRGLGIDFESFLELEAVGEAYIMQSEDHKEAVDAFMNKRPPQFKGE